MINEKQPLKEIEDIEQKIFELHKKWLELKRAMPREDISDYLLKGSDGQPLHFSDLFEGKMDLIVIHNMGHQCAYCTLWADGLNGMIQHLEARASVVMVSPDPPDIQRKFAESRGWKFRMLSGIDSDFVKKMGFTEDHDSQSYYLPGFSTFHRDEQGRIYRISYDYFAPGDLYCSIWHIFALLADGIGSWSPRIQYSST